MQATSSDQQPAFDINELSLREHLLNAKIAQAQAEQPRTPPDHLGPNSPPSHRRHNIDPAIAGPVDHTFSPDGSGGEGPENKRAKRELSSSKRAAQNRAAQRAFRQRKEGYIKELEEKVRNFHTLEENYKAIQAENYQLRDYVIELQSRLIESQGDYPQPPPAIDLQNPRDPHILHGGLAAPTAPMGEAAVRQLQAAAAAARAGEYDDEAQDHSLRFSEVVEESRLGQDEETSRKTDEDLTGLAQAASANDNIEPRLEDAS